MSPTPGEQHQARMRAGLGFLAVGFALLLFAWFSWMFRASNPELPPPTNIESQSPATGSAQPTDQPGAGQHDVFLKAAPMLLLVTFLLVIVFLGGSLILVRGLRKNREASEHRRRPPTPSDDVWAMKGSLDDIDEHAA